MRKTTFITLLLAVLWSTKALAIDVKLNPDKGIANTIPVAKMENNLTALLTEINAACKNDRPLELTGLQLGTGARETLQQLWVVAHFYCCDEEVTDRLWKFKRTFMARSIPLIIVPDAADSWAEGTFQEAVVEFDMSGNITDFRFSFSSRLGESLEKCSGSPVDVERKLEIMAWCDRLATAYNEHNMSFMQKIFSDKALIITGKVVMETNREFGTTSEKVQYTKQTKRQYLVNLAKCFKNNRWIHVEFDEILGGDCATVTQSKVNNNFYGVRLHQKWRSTNYSDDGYVFLLWNFTNGDKPQIEVRTWQPDMVGGKMISNDEIISLGDFEEDIVGM